MLGLLLAVAPIASAADGEISIPDENVTFSQDYILEGNTVRIWTSVENLSENDLLGTVRFSTQNGNINGDQPISALAESSDAVFVDWNPTTYGSYTITITAIPWENNTDDPSNNTVSRSVYVYQDTDHDGITNDDDTDMDGDGVTNDDDDFPLNGNEWTDTDGDGTGDNEDDDDDNDNVLDEDDAFPQDPLYSSDYDNDGTPDENDDDLDNDGLNNSDEEILGTDPLNSDTDGDQVEDGTDPFPLDPSEWADTDGDEIGDNEDDDSDGDGIANASDSAPYNSTPNAETQQDIYLTEVGEEVIFDASASDDPDGNIVQYIWQFGEEMLTGQTVSRSFDSTGLQTATLTVLDDSGQSDTIDIKVRVLDYRFILMASLFTLLLILLAFYIIYRYNRRAQVKRAKKKSVKKTKSKSKKKK